MHRINKASKKLFNKNYKFATIFVSSILLSLSFNNLSIEAAPSRLPNGNVYSENSEEDLFKDALEAEEDVSEISEEISKEEVEDDKDISKGEEVSNFALNYLGNPYKYGGVSLTSGVDCSGFVMKVYENFGIELPHSSSALSRVGTAIANIEDAVPGDIITYSGHAGIYIGNGKIVNALNSRKGIVITNAHYKAIKSIRRVI